LDARRTSVERMKFQRAPCTSCSMRYQPGATSILSAPGTAGIAGFAPFLVFSDSAFGKAGVPSTTSMLSWVAVFFSNQLIWPIAKRTTRTVTPRNAILRELRKMAPGVQKLDDEGVEAPGAGRPGTGVEAGRRAAEAVERSRRTSASARNSRRIASSVTSSVTIAGSVGVVARSAAAYASRSRMRPLGSRGPPVGDMPR